jgi:hypothetical protein
MNPSEAAFEGPSLEDSLQAASSSLGVPPDELDYRFDREHFLNGANTVRIFAAPRDPANAAIRATLEKFLGEEFENRQLQASARVTVTNAEVRVSIEAQSGVVPDDDASLAALAEVLREVGGEGMADRAVKVSVQAPSSPYSPGGGRERRERSGRDRDRGGGRDRDRGGRDRDRGGSGGRDRDRRGGGRDRDRDRAPRDRDRDRGPSDRPKPEKDPAREAALVAQAKEAIEQVLEDGQPVTLEGLNSYERRIIHRTVAEIEGLTTRSVGRGSLKAVRILEGEDEDEED